MNKSQLTIRVDKNQARHVAPNVCHVCQSAHPQEQSLDYTGAWTIEIIKHPLSECNYRIYININLKLYCGYKYTRPCMINRIWDVLQLWLQVNGHAWFHLHGLQWPVRNGEGAKNSNENIGLQRDSNQRYANPRQESQRCRPLGQAC